jgi:pyruvate dehydrogenase E1 component beta subunit
MSTLTDAASAGSAAPAEVELTYREAINAAQEDAMAADDGVVLIGEDVTADGGVFKTNIGLVERFGDARIRSTPICENGFINLALGMSLVGLRPIVEIMFADFLPTAGDATSSRAARCRHDQRPRVARAAATIPSTDGRTSSSSGGVYGMG